MLTIRTIATHTLTFADGAPVRAASAVTGLAGRWLIAQDDATHAALWSPDGGVIKALRLFDPIDGVDTFSEAEGTKKLKPDLEAACTIRFGGEVAAVLLGSGSLEARMRGALVRPSKSDWTVHTADLSPLYHNVASALGIPMEVLNLEGAAVVDDHLRWFQRGHASGVASAAVNVELGALLDVIASDGDPTEMEVTPGAAYDLGDVDGVPLAITDAATLPDGRLVVSAAAEDAPDAVADGPIVGAAMALLDGDDVTHVMPLPTSPDGDVWKVEGLAVRGLQGRSLDLLAVVDQDHPAQPSLALELQIELD